MKNVCLFIYYYLQVKIQSFLLNLDPAAYKTKLEYKIFKKSLNYNFFKTYKSFKSLPIFLNKKQFNDNFDQLNVAHLNRNTLLDLALQAENTRDFNQSVFKDYSVGLSTGTSGNRGVFLVSPRERIRWLASLIALAPFIPFKKQKVAFFLRANNNLYKTANESRFLNFKYFDLTRPFDELSKELNLFKPDLLIATPSVLNLLSDHVVSHKLSIQPNFVVSVADVLEESDQLKFQKVFKTKIHQIYQATEGFLGITCREGNLHLNEQWMHIEKDYCHNQDNMFSPILSDLNRETQAIIRYRLDDILVEDKTPCPCGSRATRLTKIMGRCDDVIKTYKEPIFPDFLRALIQNGFQKFNIQAEFCLVQEPNDLFVLKTNTNLLPEAQEAVSQALRSYFKEKQEVEIILLFDPSLEFNTSGKRKRVVAL